MEMNPDIYIMGGSNWNDIYYQGIVINAKRNARIVHLAQERKDKGEKVLIIVYRQDHGKYITGMGGKDFSFVYGKSEVDERDLAIECLKASGGQIVVSSNIFDEGMNFPDLNCVIYARGWESPIAATQGAGRGTRTAKNKKSFTLIDFLDITNKILKKHSLRRIKVYKELGWSVKTFRGF